MTKLLQRGEVAKMTGLTPGTIRIYAAAGILPPPAMRVRNWTLYDPEDILFFMEVHPGRPKGRKSYRRKSKRD
jgi:DNA-binding transcriptional MerR regulator